MFRSPLKTVTEKIKPVQSKSGISSLKFDRASDFKKFLGFIKTETKELEKIKLPKKTEIKPKKKRGGILGLLGLGLLGAFFGGGDDESNERTGSEGGTASQFNPGLLLSKNIRKTQKNLGLSKSVKKGKSEYKKVKNMFKKAFPKPDKKTLLRMKETRKNIKIRIQRLKKELELIKKENKASQDAKAEVLMDRSLKKDPIAKAELLKIYDDEMREQTKAFKKTRAMIDFEEFRLEANKPVGSFSIETLKDTRQILDDANVSFVFEKSLNDGKGGFKPVFGQGFDVTDRKFVETVLKENPKAAEFFKRVQGLDPLLFDVPQGGTLFSKILGKDRGIKIENRMGIVRESLDDMFTGIGKKTKPIRKFFSPVTKTIANTKTLKGALKLGRNIARPVDIGLTAITAPFQLNILENRGGLFNPNIGLDRTNIVTHLYDLFTHFYNSGVEGLGFDDAHKRLKISKPIDRELSGSIIPFTNIGAYKYNPRRITDAYNEEILEAREAKKLRDAVNANSNFNTSMLNNSSTQLPKSTPFSVQKVDGGEFNPPFDYSDMGTIDFSSAAILYKLNK